MKKKLLRQLFMASKYVLLGVFMQTLWTGMLLASDTAAQDVKSVRDVYVMLKTENGSVREILQFIESETAYSFSYYQGDIDLDKQVHFRRQRQSVYDLLVEVSAQTGLSFRQINNVINVKNKEKGKKTEEVEVVKIAIVVRGKVTDLGSGEALPGVNVLVKGTNVGTVTDVDGNYSINVDDENATLVFSYIGYVTEEVNVNERSTIDVVLAQDIQSLSEVVVIGYGERQKKDLTGAVSQIEAEDIEKTASMTPELAMQGKIAGVFVSTPGGNPNARPTVRIRGVNTFGYAEPLYVIDGVPITEFGSGITGGVVGDVRGQVNIMSLINPNDIESISVLKDASAAAIYGVRAANGVILITTKSGQAGKPRVEVNAQRGIQNIPNTYDMLNVADFTALYREAFANNPNEAANMPAVFDPNSESYLGNLPTVDWQSPLLKENAVTEDYSLKVSGGSEATTYYISGGYSRTESPLVQNNLKRYSLATNFNSSITDYLTVGVNYRLGYVDALDNTQTDLDYVARTSPWQPIYDSNGPYGFAPAYLVTFNPNPDFDPTSLSSGPLYTINEATPLWGPETNANPFAWHQLNQTDYSVVRNLGTAFLEVEPIEGLKFKGSLNVDWYYTRRNQWQDFDAYLFSQTPGNPYAGHDGTSVGSYGERHSRNTNISREFGINYNKSFGEHNIDLLLNAMDQEYTFEFIGGGTGQVNSRDPNYRESLGGQNQYTSIGNIRDRNRLQGYMARLSYNYASKYYIDGTVRRDGTSRFAPGYKWGTFPSVSAAWRISAENFMQGIDFIDDLKIRGGWGKLGNQETRSFAYLSTVSRTPDYALGSGNGNGVGRVLEGMRFPDYPVQDLTWETVETVNIAFDGMFFNNTVTLTVEYYDKNTNGILQETELAASVGNENAPILNVATVRNNGIEVQAGYSGNFGPLSFNVSGNLTTVNNRITRLYKDQPFGEEQDRKEVGYPINYLWGYQLGGIFQDTVQINEWLETYSDRTNDDNFAPGDMYFQDVHGNPEEGQAYSPVPDSIVNTNDRTFIGSTIPGFYYGLNLSAAFKGFDLSVFFQGVGDVQAVNQARWDGENMSSNGSNQWTTVQNRWTPENPSTTMPRAVYNDPANNNRFSSRWVEDADFLRLKNFQLGYTLPTSDMEFVERVRIYVSGSNVFTLTPWTGLDPEFVAQQSIGGVPAVPPARSYSLGLNVTF